MGRQLEALLILAWSLARALLRRLTETERAGETFVAQFAPDRLQPVAHPDRDTLMESSQCIGCGRCASRVAAHEGGSPVMLVLAAARSLPQLDAAAIGFGAMSPAELDECERACPAGVPFGELAAVARRASTALRSSSGDSVGPADGSRAPLPELAGSR